MTRDRPPVVWIRHGTSVDGLDRPTAHARPDTPLSDRGRDEARATADLVRELGAGRVVSSPLPRAWETARILATALDVPPDEPWSCLREWRAPDCVLGLAPGDYPPEYRRWRRARGVEVHSALPGGESLAGFARRAATAGALVNDIATTSTRPVLVVSHVLLIGAVAAHAHGIDEPGAAFAAARCFSLPPAGCWHPDLAQADQEQGQGFSDP